MNKAAIILVSFVSVNGACSAVAQSGEAYQMTGKQGRSEITMNNNQDEVLSNSETSGAARIETVRSGGNTAIINQNGSRNISSVVQTGGDNVADQTQTGEYNDLRVEQTGRHNRSREIQTGEHNRKVNIQNGSETIIEQIWP